MSTLSRLKSDYIDIRNTLRVVRHLPRLLPKSENSPARMMQALAERIPNNQALAFEDERYTWREVNDHANRYADFFIKQGIGRDDVVALVMENRPDFLFIVMGLNKIRAVGALINTNLTGKALVHAINVAKPRKVLVGGENLGAILEIYDDLEGVSRQRDLWVQLEKGLGEAGDGTVINEDVAASSAREQGNAHTPRMSDHFCYIYTSGTTGLPKAAIITNQREVVAGMGFGLSMFEATPKDVIYVTLPLYHSSAMFLGWGSAISTGASIALRRKFSATNFWKDVGRFGATGFLYIGELCRYLLNHPVQEGERNHKLRVGVGNGMRPDIWEKFQDRFGVPLIREFYGATEGNVPLMNFEGRPGMIGRMRPGQVVAKCDLATGEIIRNSQGLCDEVGVGSKGLLLGRINPVVKFDGYVDKKATESKILHDIIKKGDRYFNTGDLVERHEDGWLSFADRVGDTFRWKGENVSTNEVAEILNGAPGVLESNVYGVQVPNADGRAGMAAVTTGDGFDLDQFAKYVLDKLATYQKPYFIRLLKGDQMRITGTFKHQKVDYRKEAFDPGQVKDPLYFFDAAKKKYVPIDAELFGKIQKGEVTPS